MAEFYRGMVFLHLRVDRWGPSVMRLMRSRWPVIQEALREVGYTKIFAFYRESNRTMAAFAGRFGFREVRRNIGWVLLEKNHA